MKIEVTVDTAALEDKLYLLAKHARVEPGAVMKQETKAIAESIMRQTPPANRAQGRAKVQEDIGKVFRSMAYVLRYLKVTTGHPAIAATVRRMMKTGDMAGIQRIISERSSVVESVNVRSHRRGGGKVSAYTQTRKRIGAAIPGALSRTAIMDTVSPELHKARRNSFGRIKNSGLDAIILSAKSLREYIKQVQSRVGWARAGFASVLERRAAPCRAGCRGLKPRRAHRSRIGVRTRTFTPSPTTTRFLTTSGACLPP